MSSLFSRKNKSILESGLPLLTGALTVCMYLQEGEQSMLQIDYLSLRN